MTDGLDRFVKDMEVVSAQADQGDLMAAENAVRSAGAKLVDLGSQLRRDVVAAEQKEVKTTVTELATEFEKLGRSLTGVAALQTFDTTKLDQLADAMSVLCGDSPSPGASANASTPLVSPSKTLASPAR